MVNCRPDAPQEPGGTGSRSARPRENPAGFGQLLACLLDQHVELRVTRALCLQLGRQRRELARSNDHECAASPVIRTRAISPATTV